jgi:hypothetical protein
MVESTSYFEAEHKTLLLIGSPGDPALNSVYEDARKVGEFALRY